MKATIKGLERVEYESKKTGKEVKGVKIHIERKDPNVVGFCAESLFLGSDSLENLGVNLPPERYKDAVGGAVEYEYNRFGIIASLVICDPPAATNPK